MKCKKDIDSVKSKVLKTNSGRPMLSSKCAICGSKKSKCMEWKEAKLLLSSLSLKTPLNEITLLGDILF